MATHKVKFEGTPEEALALINLLRAEGIKVDLEMCNLEGALALIDLLRAEGMEVNLDIRAEEAEES
jgi:hypothetical protein